MRVPAGELVYFDSESGESSIIAAVDRTDDGKGPPNFAMYVTEDRVQAERWRALVAAGGCPTTCPAPSLCEMT